MKYILEVEQPYKANGIGNTKQAGVMTTRWKQIALSDSVEELKTLIRPSLKYRIQNLDNLKTVFINL